MRTLFALLAACTCVAGAEVRTVIEWDFQADGDLLGWRPNEFMQDIRVQAGLLRGKALGRDPFLTSPIFDLPTRPWQEVRMRIRCKKPGKGLVFWSNTLKTRYGGFSPKKNTRYRIQGAGDWEIVRVKPMWQSEGKIIHMRLDIDSPCEFAIDWIRIVEPAGAGKPSRVASWDFTAGDALGWTGDDAAISAVRGEGLRLTLGDKPGALRSPALDTRIDARKWVSVRMRAAKARRGAIAWFTTGGARAPVSFRVRGDGRMHTYNFDPGAYRTWRGALQALEFRPSFLPGDEVVVESIRIGERPSGPADVEIVYFGMEDAINRVGEPCRIMLRLLNHGGAPAAGVKVRLKVPEGVRVIDAPRDLADGATLRFDEPLTRWYTISADRALQGAARLRLDGPGVGQSEASCAINITERPTVAMGRIPDPQPARSKYLIGTYWYPAWETDFQWRQAERFAPIQKPVLGYYDEDNPEVVDWLIKYYVEHGVNLFLVDWYWVAGRMGHTHFVPALQKAKFRNRVKWAVMWANHNPPNTHSRQDWEKVTRFWIKHYFRTPEYLRMDGKPAVFMWLPQRVRGDMGGPEGAAEMYKLAQDIAKDAGLGGITFVSMRATDGDVAVQKQEGYTYATSYHWWSNARSFAADPQRYPYSLVADRSRPGWDAVEKRVEDAGMAFIPVADTGWDARPRHGEKTFVIYDRTPALFERILRDAKSWLDARGERMLILGPCNEWTEGSYIEPCREFGFGMLDAVRNVFCAPGPHPHIAPKDVGLGPYDFPIHVRQTRPFWTFDRGAEGWKPNTRTALADAADGKLRVTARRPNPMVESPVLKIPAADYPRVVLRMKTSPAPAKGARFRVQWSTETLVMSGLNSAQVKWRNDEEWHTYVVPVASTPRWRGTLHQLRLYLGVKTGATVWIDEMRLATGT